jgi:hypothetical protein
MPTVDAITEALTRLDAMDRAVTDWEAGFLESMLRRQAKGYATTEKQRGVVARLCEHYLHDPLLAAEVLGQERLFDYPQEKGIRR